MRMILAAALLFSASAVDASALTLSFDGVSEQTLPNGVYSESGFTFTVLSGSTFGTSTPGGGALVVGAINAPFIGDTLSLVRDDGGAFTIDALEIAGFTGSATDSVRVDALFGGSVFDSFALGTSGAAFQAVDPMVSSFADELRFVVTGAGTTSLLIDNISLGEVSLDDGPAEVPAPMPALLLLTGLAALRLKARSGARR